LEMRDSALGGAGAFTLGDGQAADDASIEGLGRRSNCRHRRQSKEGVKTTDKHGGRKGRGREVRVSWHPLTLGGFSMDVASLTGHTITVNVL
jgi:hypothetical protein